MSRPTGQARLSQACERLPCYRKGTAQGRRFVTKTQARADQRVIMLAFSRGEIGQSRALEAIGRDCLEHLYGLLGHYGFPLYHIPRWIALKQLESFGEFLSRCKEKTQ